MVNSPYFREENYLIQNVYVFSTVFNMPKEKYEFSIEKKRNFSKKTLQQQKISIREIRRILPVFALIFQEKEMKNFLKKRNENRDCYF